MSGDEESKTHSGHDPFCVTKGGPGFVSNSQRPYPDESEPLPGAIRQSSVSSQPHPAAVPPQRSLPFQALDSILSVAQIVCAGKSVQLIEIK